MRLTYPSINEDIENFKAVSSENTGPRKVTKLVIYCKYKYCCKFAIFRGYFLKKQIEENLKASYLNFAFILILFSFLDVLLISELKKIF